MKTWSDPSLGSITPVRRVSPHFPYEYFCLSDVVFQGRFAGSRDGKPISEIAIDGAGVRYCFQRIAPRDSAGRLDVGGLTSGEWIVRPDLVYREERLSPRGHSPVGGARPQILSLSRIRSRSRSLGTGHRFPTVDGASVLAVIVFAAVGISLSLL